MASMTMTRALALAEKAGLKVAGATTINGTRVYAVPSHSDAGHVHLVTIANGVAECDCKGYQYRGLCSHAAVAYAAYEMEVKADAARRQAAADAADREDAASAYADDNGFDRGDYLEYRGM